MIARRWVPTALWAAVVLAVTSVPGSNVPSGPAGADKVIHFALYAVLGLLATRAALGGRPGATAPVVARVLSAIAVFAAADELHQILVPGRSADLHDWLADVLGAAVASALTAAALVRREPST